MKQLLILILSLLTVTSTLAGVDDNTEKKTSDRNLKTKKEKRLTIGGYGEAVYTYNKFSDNFNNYSKPEKYKNAEGHGRVDLPHVVIMLGYDFGKGWSFGTEIEFEHGGTEAASELEAEEFGEYEIEIERGGEVALEQFWLQKSFSKAFNIRAGHFVVPVGYTNNRHLPTQFFTVYRPEGENTIMPCTWHQTGISLHGRTRHWRYEAMVVNSLNSLNFNNTNWIKKGASSPLEFTPSNKFAFAGRVDNYHIHGLRIGLSGYIGETFNNGLGKKNTIDNNGKEIKGLLMVGAADFDYDNYNWIVRGNFDIGHLNNADFISRHNVSQSKNVPYSRTFVGKEAMAAGLEAGYNVFSQIKKMKDDNQKLYIFGRYEYYNPYKAPKGFMEYNWTEKKRMALGVNYMPIPQIVVKAEYSKRFLKSQYNNEPSISLGIAYAGFFN